MTRRIKQFWSALSITRKLMVALSSFMLILLLIFFTGYSLLNHVQKEIEKTTLSNQQINSLVLTVRAELDESRHLEKEFFLRCRIIGYNQAYTNYVKPAYGIARNLETITPQLKQLFKESPLRKDNEVNLKLLFLAQNRHTRTLNEATELVAKLIGPGIGLEESLFFNLFSLKKLVTSTADFELFSLFEKMQTSGSLYMIKRQRPLMQSSFNVAVPLRKKINKAVFPVPAQKTEAIKYLDAYLSTGRDIIDIDVALDHKMRDFNLQSSTMKNITDKITRSANQNSRRLQKNFVSFNHLLVSVLFFSSLVSGALIFAVSALLGRTITGNIVKLAQSAHEIKNGNLGIRIHIDSEDELGDLAVSFNHMAGSLKTLINELEQKIDERTRHLNDTLHQLKAKVAEHKKTKETYALLFNSSNDAIFVHRMDDDTPGKFIEVNDIACIQLEYSHEELLEMSPLDIDAEMTDKARADAAKEIQKTGQAVFEMVHLSKSGRKIPVEISSRVFESGKERHVLAIARDISERKQAEEQLRRSEVKYRSMMESITDQLYICSPDFKVEYMNPAMIKRLGRDATGEPCHRALHGLEHRCDWCVFDTVSEGKNIETTIKSPLDGRTYRVTNMPIKNSDGSISKMTIFRDITDYLTAVEEKNKAHAQLLQAQKMKSIGTLAGGIAHDFNNILYPIIGFTEMSIEDLPENHPVIENLKDILQGAKRARDLVKQILLFSSQKEPEQKPIQMKPVIKEALKLLRATIPANIDIQHELDDDVDYILGNPTEIHEIVINMCTNAVHAMEGTGGLLKISLKKAVPDPILNLPPKACCCLEIQDNGTGIAPDVVENIFEPYFTTKALGKGSGLGLSVVHGIVKNYKGGITVDSKPDKGTTFHIYLPLITGAPEPEKNQRRKAQETEGNEHILFVDDEKPIVQVAIRFLERIGYRVTGKTDSVEALALFKTDPAGFDLVITDMAMPKMVGTEFAKQVLAIRADIPILICTGFSENLDAKTAEITGIKGFLQKPILFNVLSAKIREVLDSPV